MPIPVASKRTGLPPGRGYNQRPFQDPLTLQQAFPGLRQAPRGAIIAVADNFLNFAGPATDAQIALVRNWTTQVANDIRKLDSNWRDDRLGSIMTLEGQINHLNDPRLQRAATYLLKNGDARPLQVETLRFVQQQTDAAYAEAVVLFKAGRLRRRLSDQAALGNFIDGRVRGELRWRYNQLRIDSAGLGPVRVNRRENITSGGDLTYRRPDARVSDVAFDVTLTQKTWKTAQVRGFFAADFKSTRVVIIRPTSSAAITATSSTAQRFADEPVGLAKPLSQSKPLCTVVIGGAPRLAHLLLWRGARVHR